MAEIVQPAEMGEDQPGRVDALVGGDRQLPPRRGELGQQFADAGVGGGCLVALAVVAGLEGIGELADQGGVIAAREQLQGFGQWRPDHALVDAADRRDAGAGEGLAEAGENRRRRVDQRPVEVEKNVRIAGHGGHQSSGASQDSASLMAMSLRAAQSSSWSRPILGMAK